jgi:hypothetical protein
MHTLACCPPRFPKLHSAVIRTTVLVQHYCVALMAASGRLHSAQNHLHKHTSVETLEIVQSLIGAGRRCPAHHGPMLLDLGPVETDGNQGPFLCCSEHVV